MSAPGSSRIVTRPTLIWLAVITAGSFAVSAILGNHRHGTLKVVANASWTVLWIAALALVVVGATMIARARKAGD